MLRQFLYRNFYTYYKKSGLARMPKKRRFKKMDVALHGMLSQAERDIRIVDIGCAHGSDFIQFAKENSRLDVYGIDIVDSRASVDDFKFIQADAASIDVPDNHFDLVVSIGVLEHVEPISKLQDAIKEISRVSKSYCVIVPSLACIIEPHTLSLFWQIRDHNKKVGRSTLNYYSDEAWLQFDGFSGAKVQRFFYLPGISNLMIYKNDNT